MLDIDTKSIIAKRLFPGRFYDAAFIAEYGKIESMRASRYNTCFSVVFINIEGLGAKSILEDDTSLEFIRKLVAIIVESVRNCDVVGLHDERQIAAILPETDYFGSLAAIRKLSKSISFFLKRERSKATVLFSQATFPKDGKGFGEILSTAVKRIPERRESLWEKMDLKGKLFWEIMGELSGKVYEGFDNASFDAGGTNPLTEFYIDQINELVVKEITRTPQKRGIAYFAAKNIFSGIPALKPLSSAGTMAAKVFLVGEAGERMGEIKNTTAIPLDDPRLREVFFTFYLNEDSGYALISRENWGATFSCFHTADPCVVEGLINKFQVEYSLQEQLG